MKLLNFLFPPKKQRHSFCELYDEAKLAASELRKGGLVTYAEEMEDAIRYSSVGGEICMKLRYIFKNLLGDTRVKLPKALRESVRRLHRELDQILR